jgi:hypothetical protein
LFYRFKVSLLIERFILNPDLYQESRISELLRHKGFPEQPLKEILLELTKQEEDIIDKLAPITGIDFDVFLNERKPYMTTGQIQSLQKQGFRFGAHSIDHPDFRTISLEAQLSQLEKSIHWVKENLNEEKSLFSFPFTDDGVSDAFFKKLEAEKLADFTFGTAGLKHERYKTHFQRIPLEVSGYSAEEIIKSEMLYYLFKSLSGKNKIRRL